MLYTSYIGNLDKIYDIDTIFLIVTRVNPKITKYSNVHHVPELSPSPELFKRAKYEGLEYSEYFQMYTDQMPDMKEDIEKIVNFVKSGRDVVLLCYEKEPEFCHRKILAEHIRDNYYGIFYTEKKPNTVHTFHNKYRFLSNFYPVSIKYKGFTYPSVENAYQASKTDNEDDKIKFISIPSNKAKGLGRKIKMKDSFESEKRLIMKELIEIKFQDKKLRRDILKTGTMELIEGNIWHDNFYGSCQCIKCKDKEGRNVLGRTIMEVRSAIVSNSTTVKSCCFSGHRPKYFGSYDLQDEVYRPLIDRVDKEVDYMIENGVNTFLSGGALGIDMVAFWVVEKKKKENPDIRNILCLPYCIQGDNWSKKDRDWLSRMKSRADEVIMVDELDKYRVGKSGKYSSFKLQKRNEYMVDNSEYMIAVWNGKPSGTKNCIDYAIKNGSTIKTINV